MRIVKIRSFIHTHDTKKINICEKVKCDCVCSVPYNRIGNGQQVILHSCTDEVEEFQGVGAVDRKR